VQELEALSERDFITDEQYDTIMSALPAEASLHNTVLPIPGRSSAAASSTSPTPLSDNFAAMSVNDRNPSTAATSVTSNTSPPSYNQTPAPLPPRNPQPPQHNEIAHVAALYHYSDPDPRDLNFEPGDHISVTEYCNLDWWRGKNVRSGEEGIFPKNYVRIENTPSPLAQQYSNEKAPGYMYGGPPPQQPMGGYYPNQPLQHAPPGPSSPYDGPVPPMEIAEQPTSHTPSKGAEMGKKFGRKLGNAAIFGAGATLGADVVNSIF
jgi:hypothetical protein